MEQHIQPDGSATARPAQWSPEPVASNRELLLGGHQNGAPQPERTDSVPRLPLPTRPKPAVRSATVEQQGVTRLQDAELQVEASRQFFHQIPPRLAKIRLDICALSRLQSVAGQQSGLVGLAMQCQWLAGYAKLANFPAVAQVAGAFETFVRDIQSRSILLTEAMTRTMCQTVDLLNSLASCTPGNAGSAEGARVMVLDESPPSRLSALAALERVGIVGIGIASIDTAFGLLSDNAVDLIIVRSESTSNMGPRVCQAIRRLPRHARTPILMLLPSGTWERCAVLAMSGATEVVVGSILNAELAMKVLDHFFQGRLSGR